MNRYMNVPMKVAVGTSKLMIGVTAAVSSILFFLAGLIHFPVVAPVALGTTIGASIGTMVMNRLHSSVLKWIFTALMAYLTYGMLAKALDDTLRRPPAIAGRMTVAEHSKNKPTASREENVYVDVYRVLLAGMLISSALFAIGWCGRCCIPKLIC